MSKTFKSEGIILRALKYSESSLILDVLTQELGLQSCIVSGVRKAKSVHLNLYRPLNIVNIVAYNNQGLSRVKEGSFAVLYNKLNLDVTRSAVAMYMVDLVRTCIVETENNAAMYSYIRQALTELDISERLEANYPLLFAIQLARHLGFGVDNNFDTEHTVFDMYNGQFIHPGRLSKYTANETVSVLLHKVLDQPDVKLSRQDRNDLLDMLHTFYQLHLENFIAPKSVEVLRVVLG